MALDLDLKKYAADFVVAGQAVDKATFQVQTYPQLFPAGFTVERLSLLNTELNRVAAAFTSAAALIAALRTVSNQ